jgi:tetratricopeptide (TPR) repeat protein
MRASMSARAILDEVQAEVQRRLEANGGKPLPPKEQSELRKWKIARYTEAIQLDPLLAEAYAERGADLYFEHRRVEAQTDMRKAFALRPRDAELYLSMSYPFEGDEKREILDAGMSLADTATVEFEQLRDSFIGSYWYDGDFSQYVRLLEEWLPQLDPAGFVYCHELQSVAQGYSALGDDARAEAAYRRALAVSRPSGRAIIAEMIIRTRMHRGEYAEARQAIGELRFELASDRYSVFDAALLVLLDPGSEETRTAAEAALSVAERLGRAPGPLGNSTSYYSFLLGLIYKGAGRQETAFELLRRFAAESAANKREWAITLRWEIAKALEAAS